MDPVHLEWFKDNELSGLADLDRLTPGNTAVAG